MNDISYEKLDALLDSISNKANISRGKSDLDTLAEIINRALDRDAFGNSFFYALHNKVKFGIKNGKSNEAYSMRESNLNQMILYLTDKRMVYKEYIISQSSSLSPILESLKGCWYSYVRCNSGLPLIYKSPVFISKNAGGIQMELRGGSGKIFSGKAELISQNIISSIKREGGDKSLNLVFRLGNTLNPTLLQGVYSGISSNGDPICGKELLIRANTIKTNNLQIDPHKWFSQLENREINMESDIDNRAYEESKEQLGLLFSYFSNYLSSVIKIKQYAKFSWDDLRLA